MSRAIAAPTLGQLAYEAFLAELGSTALLPWAELGEPVRLAWYAASVTVVEVVWKQQHREIVEQWKTL